MENGVGNQDKITTVDETNNKKKFKVQCLSLFLLDQIVLLSNFFQVVQSRYRQQGTVPAKRGLQEQQLKQSLITSGQRKEPLQFQQASTQVKKAKMADTVSRVAYEQWKHQPKPTTQADTTDIPVLVTQPKEAMDISDSQTVTTTAPVLSSPTAMSHRRSTTSTCSGGGSTLVPCVVVTPPPKASLSPSRHSHVDAMRLMMSVSPQAQVFNAKNLQCFVILLICSIIS
jgi:hypothetical protein